MKKLLLLLLCAIGLSASDVKIVESKHSVSQTIQNIKKIVTSKGFKVFAIIDHKQNAKNVDMQMSEAKVILFGNPKAGTKLMQEDIRTALDLPLRILVYKESGVKIAYRDVSSLKADFKLKNKKQLKAMDKGLSAIIDEARN
ncbi:MAG: DUF302 domain-containing protein [Sulfurimonas sp.]|uniref:DUF302 domain-containing protein n=1 Tax=Sulfurimonas sp. TaxID=2022749 RepID=UPI0025F24343|nr:DUF302 domain-containing protein [Sulfurimonas sp.]MCK9491989.1 DUF302 domain-containing protein [Sulfurimonas sp.]